MLRAIEEAGYLAGSDVLIGMDCAASEFYKDGKYRFEAEKLSYTAAQFVDLMSTWCDKYPIISIEDGMAEQDWDGWELLTQKLGRDVQLVGDDVFVTNTRIFAEGIQRGVAKSIIIKINQTAARGPSSDRDGAPQRDTSVISHRSGRPDSPSPTSPWAPTRCRSRRARSRVGPTQVQPLLRIEGSWARARNMRCVHLPTAISVAPAQAGDPIAMKPLAYISTAFSPTVPLWLARAAGLACGSSNGSLASSSRPNLRSRRATTRDADVRDQGGSEALEERARFELGMIARAKSSTGRAWEA